MQLTLEKIAYRPKELLALLPIGRSTLYAAIKRGDIRPRKFGRATLILRDDVADFLARLPDCQAVGRE